MSEIVCECGCELERHSAYEGVRHSATSESCGYCECTSSTMRVVSEWNNAQLAALQARVAELEVGLYHIAHKTPADDAHLDWHEEWRDLRKEARAALGVDATNKIYAQHVAQFTHQKPSGDPAPLPAEKG